MILLLALIRSQAKKEKGGEGKSESMEALAIVPAHGSTDVGDLGAAGD